MGCCCKEIILQYTVKEVQEKAKEVIGRELTPDELVVATKQLKDQIVDMGIVEHAIETAKMYYETPETSGDN